MPRELIKFTPEETKQGIILYEDGEVHVITDKAIGLVIAGLSPRNVMDFIKLPDGRRTLIVSDVPIKDASQVVEGAEFVLLQEVEVETGSWSLPLCLSAIVARSWDSRDNAWFVLEEIAGQYLEKDAVAEQVRPWQRGWVAAVVRANWKSWQECRAVSGESHWGWIRGRYHLENGGESWDSVKMRFEGWIRAADVFLRNVEERKWIADLTLNQILEVPISKAIRCCGAITEGLFAHYSLGPGLQKALFDPTKTNSDLNHLMAKARVDRDKMPERVVDGKTGEIEYVIPATGEVVDESELDQYLPEETGDEEIDVSNTPSGIFWTYNYETKMFGYWMDNAWTPGLSVQTDTPPVRRFVDQIIAACNVAAEYDDSGSEKRTHQK